jgi:hypothetical protein
MVRRLMVLIVGFVILFGLLTAASTIIGRGIDTPVAAALISPDRTRSAVSPAPKIVLFDLSRSLRADRTILLPDVRQVTFTYAALDHVFITTYTGDSTHEYVENHALFNWSEIRDGE